MLPYVQQLKKLLGYGVYLQISVSSNQKLPNLHEDNQGAIALTKNPKTHSRTKHIDIKYHYTQEVVEKKDIELVYCATDQMIAETLKKGLPTRKFEELRTMIGITSFNEIFVKWEC